MYLDLPCPKETENLLVRTQNTQGTVFPRLQMGAAIPEKITWSLSEVAAGSIHPRGEP